jgi:hypothetical protein
MHIKRNLAELNTDSKVNIFANYDQSFYIF